MYMPRFKQQFEDYIIYKMMLNSECQTLMYSFKSLQNGIKDKKKPKYHLTICFKNINFKVLFPL